MTDPIRGLSDEFLLELDVLADRRAEPNWWRDVLRRDDLFIAVRKEYINVYYQGCSIWQVLRQGNTLVPRTHAKYLVRNRQSYPALKNGRFTIEAAAAIWTDYKGPKTLKEMMTSAKTHSGVEKIGVHQLASANPNVVDLELNLAASGADEDAQQEEQEQERKGDAGQRKFDRIDLASIDRAATDGAFTVTFWEAKHFSNQELRAREPGKANIYDQMERYTKSIARERDAIVSGYREICKALIRIDAMRARVRGDDGEKSVQPLDKRIRDFATEPAEPDVDVGLVIFGFDNDQKLGAAFEDHIKPLQRKFPGKVRVIGSARNTLKPGR